MKNTMLISFLLRVGLAVVFLYAAISSFLEPTSWIGFLPSWLKEIIPGDILLAAFSIFELLLGLWLLSGKWVKWAAILSALTMAGIVIANIQALDIVFRDVAILFMAITLIVLDEKKD